MLQKSTPRSFRLVKEYGRFGFLVAAFLSAMLLFTGFSAPKTTYLITDEDVVYTVEGYSGDVSEAFVRAVLCSAPMTATRSGSLTASRKLT
jgi:hypothetical protein